MGENLKEKLYKIGLGITVFDYENKPQSRNFKNKKSTLYGIDDLLHSKISHSQSGKATYRKKAICLQGAAGQVPGWPCTGSVLFPFSYQFSRIMKKNMSERQHCVVRTGLVGPD